MRPLVLALLLLVLPACPPSMPAASAECALSPPMRATVDP